MTTAKEIPISLPGDPACYAPHGDTDYIPIRVESEEVTMPKYRRAGDDGQVHRNDGSECQCVDTVKPVRVFDDSELAEHDASVENALRKRIMRDVQYLGQDPQGIPWYVKRAILGDSDRIEA